jgi:DNA-directed RNA polymerase beta subunit
LEYVNIFQETNWINEYRRKCLYDIGIFVNQEDSMIINRSSVDRGMFVHTCYKTLEYKEAKKTSNSYERIELPPTVIQMKGCDYSKLGENGIIVKGATVNKGDVIVGKTLTKIHKEDDEEKTDCSLKISVGEEGIVDGIWDGFNEEGSRLVKIRIRQLRTPEVGDKFSSRFSQKGVAGLFLRQEDMPFTESGIVPDLLMSALSYPSRMTVSQLLESLYGKVSTLNGKIGDSTAFSSASINPVERIANELKSFGFNKYGNEKMFSGYTGEMLDVEIFIGPCYYQRLKHLVSDKMHSRASGNVTALTFQPTDGRSSGGGLRIGIRTILPIIVQIATLC